MINLFKIPEYSIFILSNHVENLVFSVLTYKINLNNEKTLQFPKI